MTLHLERSPSPNEDQDRVPGSSVQFSIPSFEELFEKHVSMVWRVLRAMGVNPHQIEDAAQDVFFVVHNKLNEFEGRSQLSTWIYGITLRVGHNYRRKLSRQPEQQELQDGDLMTRATPEQEAQDSQSSRLVVSFCEGLDDGMRDVFVLCFLEERRPVEVAELLGLKQQTVYSRVRILRAAFRETLEREQGTRE